MVRVVKGGAALIGLTALLLGASFVSVQGFADLLPGSPGGLVWVVAGLMLLALPFLLVKPMNLALLEALGSRAPGSWESDRVQWAWQAVGGETASHTVLVSDRDGLLADIGFHAVSIPRIALERMAADELRALMLQRKRRQESLVAPMLGLSVWAASPMIAGVGLAYALYKAVRMIAKAMGGAADGLNPKSEFGAGVGLLLYLAGFLAFLVALVVGAVVLFQGVFAAAFLALGAWVFRRADSRTFSEVAREGHGAALLSALALLEAARPPSTRLYAVFSPRASLRALTTGNAGFH